MEEEVKKEAAIQNFTEAGVYSSDSRSVFSISPGTTEAINVLLNMDILSLHKIPRSRDCLQGRPENSIYIFF